LALPLHRFSTSIEDMSKMVPFAFLPSRDYITLSAALAAEGCSQREWLPRLGVEGFGGKRGKVLHPLTYRRFFTSKGSVRRDMYAARPKGMKKYGEYISINEPRSENDKAESKRKWPIIGTRVVAVWAP